jgi:3-polyprenyl-4-hydroxybenzoate decarboxylase
LIFFFQPVVEHETHRVRDLITLVKSEMKDEDLMRSFKAITENIQKKKTGKVSKASTKALDPSPSSQPTGSKWTFDALAQNIKAALNINPVNTGAIKDVLSLPFKDQLTLLGAITER